MKQIDNSTDAGIVLQDKFLDRFFDSAIGSDFYLTGGTALVRFYFHHRESVDLDFFTQNQTQDFSLVNRSILQIAHTLQLKIVNQITTDTFLQYIFVDNNETPLKVDIVRDIPIHFGALLSRDNVRLDSIENIGSNKILAVFGRVDAKDFIDLYWILHHTSFTFDHLYDLAGQKDLGLFDLYFAYALQQVDKINQFPRMLQPINWEEVVRFYQDLAQTLLLRIKPDVD